MSATATGNEKIEERKAKLAAIKALLEHPGYLDVLLPEFRKRAEHHKEQTRSRDLTPTQRAEHIEASFAFEELAKWLPSVAKSLESSIEQIKAGKK